MRENIDLIKQLIIKALLNRKFSYAEIIIALGELIAMLAQKSVDEDLP